MELTKPVIINRVGKAVPLTFAEHDTNFANLRNATLTVKAGTGGTDVVSDLNGVITLVAGSNITVTGDNTAKTVTIASTGGEVVSDLTPQLGGDLSVNGFKIVSEPASNGNIVLEPNGTGDVLLKTDTIRVGTTVAAQIFALQGEDLILGTSDTGYVNQLAIRTGANGNIDLTPPGTGKIQLNGPLRITGTTGTPVTYENGYYEDMLVTPVAWLKIDIGGADYYLPLFQ